MRGEAGRHSDGVEVPDVVGLAMSTAREVAEQAGLTLAQPNPDGPPLAALTWPGEFVVTAQRPAPGARLGRWDALVVEWAAAAHGDDAGVREPPRPVSPLDTLAGARELEQEPER